MKFRDFKECLISAAEELEDGASPQQIEDHAQALYEAQIEAAHEAQQGAER